MASVIVECDGRVALPEDVRERYGRSADARVDLVETPGGILLVPRPSDADEAGLREELAEWQAATRKAWSLEPYEAGQ